jgi:hypothetical protein
LPWLHCNHASTKSFPIDHNPNYDRDLDAYGYAHQHYRHSNHQHNSIGHHGHRHEHHYTLSHVYPHTITDLYTVCYLHALSDAVANVLPNSNELANDNTVRHVNAFSYEYPNAIPDTFPLQSLT